MRDRIENFLKILASIPHDKLLHFFYGYAIFKFSSLFVGVYIALGIVTIFAIGKEIYDYKHPEHDASFLDIVYTISVGVIESLIKYLS